MYRSLRPRLGRRRWGEPTLLFSTPWPKAAVGRLYLASEFTAFFPGRVELRRSGDRGYAEVPVREGAYHYFFMDSLYNVFGDWENPTSEEVQLGRLSVEAAVARAGLDELERAEEEGGFHPELLLHDERWPGYLSGYGGTTVIRLFAVRGEVDEVYVEVFDGDRWTSTVAELRFRDRYRDYFEATAGRVLAYRFKVVHDGRPDYFGVDGLGSGDPWRPSLDLGEPAWFVGATYYLVFPDSFAGARSAEGERPRARLGGNLLEAARRLEYVKDLGFDAIYLTPIYVSGSYHGYDVIDHESVAEELGGFDAFNELVREARRLGVKVVLDMVLHHTSPCAKEFREAVRSGSKSRYWSWYRFLARDLGDVDAASVSLLEGYMDGGCRSLPQELRSRKPFYESFYSIWSMPKLNYEEPEVVERACRLVRYWLSRGADGIRVDVAHGLPDKVMARVRECAKGAKEDAVVIMEIMGEASAYPLHELADSAMNYEARGAILDFVGGKIDSERLVAALMRQYLRLPLAVANSMYNLLGSHDTPRVLTLLGDRERVVRALAIEYLIYGAPSVYYGDEVGMEGGPDPDNRRPMVWSPDRWDLELVNTVRLFNRLRSKEPAMRWGLFAARPYTSDGVLLARWWGGDAILALVSRSRVPALSLPRVSCDVLAQRGVGESYVDGFLVLKCRRAALASFSFS